MIELTQEQREAGWDWIDWLRDPFNEQTSGRLQGISGYCCLGGACELQRQKNPDLYEWQEVGFEGDVVGYRFVIDDNWDTAVEDYLPRSLKDVYGLVHGSGIFVEGDFIVINGQSYNTLAAANDSGSVSFAQIADWLEANVYGPREEGASS